MGTQRTTNKDIAEKLDTLIGLLTAQAMNAPTLPVKEEAAPSTIKVDSKYKAIMEQKAQDFANKHGTNVVLYARHNTRGETKLAFAQAERFTNLRDRGLIGGIATFDPAS